MGDQTSLRELVGPLELDEIRKKLLFLNKYDRKLCKIYYGTRALTQLQENMVYVENVLNVGHWFLLLKFGKGKNVLIESSKLGRLRNMKKEDVEKVISSNGSFYFRKSEGVEILSQNQLIRIKENHVMNKIDEENLTLISKSLFHSRKLVDFCFEYLEEPYNYIDRNCQSFIRSLSYRLVPLDQNSRSNLNFDGASYVIFAFFIILIVIFLYEEY